MEAELTDGGGTIVYANNIPGTPPAMPLPGSSSPAESPRKPRKSLRTSSARSRE